MVDPPCVRDFWFWLFLQWGLFFWLGGFVVDDWWGPIYDASCGRRAISAFRRAEAEVGPVSGFVSAVVFLFFSFPPFLFSQFPPSFLSNL